MATHTEAQQFLSAIGSNGSTYIDEALCNALDESHELLWEVFKLLQTEPEWRRGASVRDLMDTLDFIAPFVDDSPVVGLATLAQWRLRWQDGTDWKRDMLSEHKGDLTGVQLFNGNMHALLLQDASAPGRVRASYFNEHGFFGHSTKESYSELLDELWDDGYRSESLVSLDEMFMLPSFQAGMAQAFAIQAHG